MESLLSYDKSLFYLINKTSAQSFLDPGMIFLSGSYPWIILLAVILIWGFYFKGLSFLRVSLALVLLVALTDSLSYRILKPNVGRKRPCIELKDIRTVDSCGGEFGFPSNHSANALALASFLHFYFRRKWLTLGLGVFAIFIGLSRVYLGAHYPLDVFAGYILGALLGSGVYYLGRYYLKQSD